MKTGRAVLRDGRTAWGLALLGGMALVAILAPVLAPFNPIAQHDILATRFLAPFTRDPSGAMHWLGTDNLGRDLLSRLLYGARISLSVGLLAAGLAAAIGTVIGAVAALAGGAVERALMALTDGLLALPRLVLLLAMVAFLTPSFGLIVVIIGATGWMSIARLARAEVHGLLARPFVDAARVAGATPVRLLFRHLLPNALTPILVAAALGVANAIGLEAGLAFLGMGVPAPAPSWGNMIATGRDALVQAPWLATIPGLAIVLAVIACNLVADGVREA
ncbi:MAG TPA: ABC transporter permease [Gemmatimonadales bacterium]|nr:ABC transporter permease [Gemmatimonadales bacterium]